MYSPKLINKRLNTEIIEEPERKDGQAPFEIRSLSVQRDAEPPKP